MTWLQSCLPLSFILFAFAGTVQGGVLFSSLEQTIKIQAKIESQNAASGIAKAGQDTLIISWGLNTDLPPEVDDDYSDVQLKFCFAPESQKLRGWRKTYNDLHRDKTCTIDICSHPWYSAVGNGSVWHITKDIPGATYFVRIYAFDRQGREVGYGQTTDEDKTTNLITIDPYTGRHGSIDIASLVLSAISIGSLVGFLTYETYAQRSMKKKGGR